MLKDFRKTALIAGIAMAASALWSFLAQLLIGPHRSTSEFVFSIAFSLFLLLLELPLPVLLVLLYRTDTRPSLSGNLRLAAAALAAIRGAFVLFEIRDVWRAGIPPAASRVALSASSQSWYFLATGSHFWTATLVISDAVNLGSRLAFVFFLVALASQAAPARRADGRASRQVRNAALTAIFVRALSMLLALIGYRVYAHAALTYGHAATAPSLLPMLRNELFSLPGLIAPMIILAELRNGPKPWRQPGSSASAHCDAAASSPEA